MERKLLDANKIARIRKETADRPGIRIVCQFKKLNNFGVA